VYTWSYDLDPRHSILRKCGMMGFVMIEVLRKDDQSIPVIICDVCAEPIFDAEMGMVAYESSEENDYIAMGFLHKGDCDNSYKGGRKRTGGWVELRHFLVLLCKNSGMAPGSDSMKRAEEERKDLDRL
jgi:hypothetical protein